MAFFNLYPVVITVLLLLLTFSLTNFLLSASVFGVTTIVTCICCRLQVQLQLESLFYYVIKAQKQAGKYLLRSSSQEPGTVVHLKEDGLQSLPKPIANILRKYIQAVLRDFIESWYTTIGPGEREFLNEVRVALEYISCEAFMAVSKAHVHHLAADLIRMFQRHVKIFNECKDAVNKKYPGISEADMEICISELYDARIIKHVATTSKGAEIDYLKALLDVLLFKLVPSDIFSCESGRFMLKEILAVQLLDPLLNDLTDSHFINESLVDILEPGVPLELVIFKYREEMNRMERDFEKLGPAKDGDISGQETSYESSHEDSETSRSDFKSPISQPNISLHVEKDTRLQRNSKASFESDDESALNQVILFNKLEARASEPVYGSTSVRHHEKSQPQFNTAFNSLHCNIATSAYSDAARSLAPSEAADSGVVASIDKFSKMEHHLSAEQTEGEISQVFEFDDHVTAVSSEPDNLATQNGSLSLKVCPAPPSADMLQKGNISKMRKKLKRKRERVKYKSKLVGDALETTRLNSERGIDKDLTTGRNTIAFPYQKALHNFDVRNKILVVKDVVSDEVASVGNDITKVYSSGMSGAFYEIASTCPTCIEMTCMASPFVSDKPLLVKPPEEVNKRFVEHDCGLSEEHFCNREAAEESILPEPADSDSFASCSDVETEDLSEIVSSSGTLLASMESLGTSLSSYKTQHAADNFETTFDIVSLDSLNFNESAETSSLHESSYDELVSVGSSLGTTSYQLITHHSKCHRTRSIQTFKSVIEHSAGETPSGPLSKKSSIDASRYYARNNKLLHRSKLVNSSKAGSGMLSLNSKFSSGRHDKSRSPIRKAKLVRHGSKLKSVVSIFSQIAGSDSELGKKMADNAMNLAGSPDRYSNSESSSVFSEASVSSLSTSQNFNSIPGSSLPSRFNVSGRDKFMDTFIEEVGAEAIEADQYLDEFEDARSQFYCSSADADLPVDPLSYSIAVNDKGTPADVRSVKSFKSGDSRPSEKSKESAFHRHAEADGKFIPMYEGEVIMPHPSKHPATAWLYPMQMISVPGTEMAYEKGWEPGINKYTLYSIHYDIRIWPDLYSNQIMGSNTHKVLPGHAGVGEGHELRESVPLIREIKRRYREFLYLHNRLSHGPMSRHMKGILRPNRRYAMPFGRMDPDVIEGRRKILEYYLVSLVSRPELCNSREFKEFLGAEGYDNVSFIKPKQIPAKKFFNEMNKLVADIKTSTFSGPRDQGLDKAESGLNYQYFIHGYDVPRMFGYADNISVKRHSALWVAHYVDACRSGLSLDRCQGDSCPGDTVMAQFEFVQKPKPYGMSTNGDVSVDVGLDVRTDGDVAEVAEEPSLSLTSSTCRERAVRFDDSAKKHDGRREMDERSIHIAALFSEELAAQLREEKELLALSKEKDLFESSWPITDSILSLLCEILKGYDSWLTYEKVQQAILFGLGGVIEWLLARELDEVVMKEKWFKYLTDLYDTVWDGETLRPKKPKPTRERRKEAKEEALRRLIDVLPSFVMMSVGPSEFRRCCEQLLNTLQYQKINKHVLYAALEIVLLQLDPKMAKDNPSYLNATSLSASGSFDKAKRKS